MASLASVPLRAVVMAPTRKTTGVLYLQSAESAEFADTENAET